MRLLKFSPEQIMDNWAYIKECILLALPPYVVDNPNSILRIQEQLLLEYLECWGCVDDELNKLFGIVTTLFAVDDITLTKNLLIFTITTTGEHEQGVWQDGYRYLSQYARSRDCCSIIAYTNQPQVIMLADSLHADTQWRFLQFPLL